MGDVNGRFRALDDETGAVLWEVNLGSPVSGFPVTYAVDGRQYVVAGTGTGGQRLALERDDSGAAPEQRQQHLRLRPSRVTIIQTSA